MKKRIAIVAAVLSVLCSGANQIPTPAQFGQGYLDGIYQSAAKSGADVLTAYYQEHKTLPRAQPELDDVLCKLYTRINGASPDLLLTPISNSENYRVLGSLRIKLDPTIANPPLDQWRKNPPENWNVSGGSVVLLSDGDSQFVIWVAELNGAPMRDSNNNCIFIARNLNPVPQQ